MIAGDHPDFDAHAVQTLDGFRGFRLDLIGDIEFARADAVHRAIAPAPLPTKTRFPSTTPRRLCRESPGNS